MLRYAFHSLKRTPLFSLAATLTLVLGVGAVTAMFAIVHGVLLAPLPYAQPDRLVSLSLTLRSPELRRIQQPSGAYFTYRRFAHRIDDVGFHRTGSANIWGDAGADEPERVAATWMTTSTFSTLGVSPFLGRAFTTDEDRPNGPNVVIISEPVWRTRFLASRDVLGKTLYVNSVPRTIVGVMSDRFRFPGPDTRIWLPARLDSASAVVGDFSWSAVARLHAGAEADDARRELAGMLPRMAELFPRLESGSSTAEWSNQTRPSLSVTTLRDEITTGIAKTLWILAAAAALVLIVACANVSNLMLIRADGRQLELAIRQALGASRLRVVSSFFGESVILASGACLVGLASAWAAVAALVAFGPTDIPRLAELHIDAVTVATCAIVSVVVAIVCSVVPAFRIRRATLSISLRDIAPGRARQRLRAAIASLQIAVALVVLSGSALLLRTFQRLSQEQPGFDARDVTTAWMQLPLTRYRDSAVVTFYARLISSVSALPSVQSAGLTARLPLGGDVAAPRSVRAEGETHDASVASYSVDRGYFSTMSIPLVAGRRFDPIGLQRDREIMISRRAAVILFHDSTGRAAIGKRLEMIHPGMWFTIIGVADNVRDVDLATVPAATVYMPQAIPSDTVYQPRAPRTMALVVKSTNPNVVNDVRRIVRDLDPTLPLYNVRAMSDVVRGSVARLSLTLVVMAAAGVITLVLGAVGLYGVIAYVVSLRARELGLRLALGADPMQLSRMVVGQGLTLIAAGVGVGLLLFVVATRFLQTLLYGVSAYDPVALTAATLSLAATAALASWMPARRVSRLDPAAALRAD